MNFNSEQDPKKKEISNKRSFALRLNVFFFCIFLLFSVLIVRLAFLQFVEGREINAELGQTDSRTLPIAPIRGNIYDKKGYALAYTVSSQSLYFRLEPNYTAEQLIDIARRLSSIFTIYGDGTAMTSASILEAMDAGFDMDGDEVHIRNRAFVPRLIKSNLTPQEVAFLLENRDEFRGLEIIEEAIREYDPNTIAVQLVGHLRLFDSARNEVRYYQDPERAADYLTEEVVGLDGIELMYQEMLRGQTGTKTYPVNAVGRIIGEMEVESPQKGHNLYLTIDKDVQLATEQAIEDQLAYLHTEEARLENSVLGEPTIGYAVAIEVETGKVVAMASMPDYDVNIWNGGRWISTEAYNRNQIFFNNGTIRTSYPLFYEYEERIKHASSMVPPGSIIKPLTVLAGLNEGVITATETYYDSGEFRFGRDGRVANANRAVHGTINAEGSLAVSSNTYMAELIGNRLFTRSFNAGNTSEALDIWDEYMEYFGLGIPTGSRLPNEYAGLKEYLNLEQMGSVQSALIFSSFGQGARYTTLQLAQYVATLASRGERMRPLLVDKITTYDGITVEEASPEVLSKLEVPEAYWNVIERGMGRVRPDSFRDFPYSYAAKTGTSQSAVAGGDVNNASFIAYAPADKPKLAIAVVIPEGGYGARGAAPVARKIFEAYDEFIGLTDVDE